MLLWLVNLGLAGGGVAVAVTAAGWPEGRKRVVLPDGRRLMLTPQEISVVRQQLEAERAQQLAEIEAKPNRKRKKARKKLATQQQEIEVAGEMPILLPPRISALAGFDDGTDFASQINALLRQQEDDALLLLLMVS